MMNFIPKNHRQWAGLAVCAVTLLILAIGWSRRFSNDLPSPADNNSRSLAAAQRSGKSVEPSFANSRLRSLSPSEPMPEPLPNPAKRPPTAIDQLPLDEQSSLQAAIQQVRHAIEPLEPAFAAMPINHGASHFAANPGQQLTARFLDNGGVRFQSGVPGTMWQTTFRLKSTAGDSWDANETRAELQHGEIAEWYVNQPEGFEHGFTLKKRPASLPENEPVTLQMTVSELRAAVDPANEANLIFADLTSGQAVLGYRDLKVWDADGKQLSARMRPSAEGFLIAVNDTAAAYPITIDPLVVSLEAEVNNGDGNAKSPYTVAISGDFMVVGFETYQTNTGCAYVFKRLNNRWAVDQKLTDSTGATNDYFGAGVAISGTVIAVGAPEDDNNGNNSGSVTLFNNSGSSWNRGQSFNGVFEEQQSHFGLSIAIDGDLMAIGAPGTSTSSGVAGGKAHVFRKTTGTSWAKEVVLQPPGLAVGDLFGASVAVNGGRVLVGSPGDDDRGSNSGSAYIFEKIGNLWADPAKLLPSSGDGGDAFGNCVAFGADFAVVGAPQYYFSASAPLTGAAFVFTPVGGAWTEKQRLLPSNVAVSDYFGAYLCISGNTIIGTAGNGKIPVFTRNPDGSWGPSVDLATGLTIPAGSYFQPAVSGDRLVVGSFPGRVLSFIRQNGNWVLEEVVAMGDGLQSDELGTSVAIEGDIALLGAPFADTAAGIETGAVTILERTNGSWAAKGTGRLRPLTPVLDGRFGWSLAISNGVIVVGSEGENSFTGALYVFTPIAGTANYSQVRLARNGGVSPDRFAYSVAIDGNRIIAGVPNAKVGTLIGAGKVVVFTRGTTGAWTQVEFQAMTWADFFSSVPDASAYSRFGFSVAIKGTSVIVGAPHADLAAPRQDGGKAYIYSLTEATGAWNLVAPLTPDSQVGAGAWFGYSVAMNAGYVVIGAPGGSGIGWEQTIAGDRKGKVYIFAPGFIFWDQKAVLTLATPSATGDFFGNAVAINSANWIMVGAPQRGTGSGKAYLFNGSNFTWAERGYFGIPSASSTLTRYGGAVAIDNGSLIIGAPSHTTDAATAAGSGYIYGFSDASLIPSLSIAKDGQNVVLTWLPSPGWSLYQSPTLLSGSWTPINVPVDGTFTYPTTSATKMFFRLQSR